jgi:geranylgeranyl diphosphate synthase type II
VDNSIENYLKKSKKTIDEQLLKYISTLSASSKLKEAMHYSIEAGGKRLRPILLMATMEALGGSPEKGFTIAAALEMVHTYSLIHDDLPAMDNDDLRRGKATNHIVFGEASAILAGDALLTYAFEIAADNHENAEPSQILQLISKLAQAAGPEGMVGGQQEDLLAEGQRLSLEQLESIHLRKTGRLLAFAVEAGAILGGADEYQKAQLKQFAFHLGIAFQIRDDILDIEGNEELIGKPVGSDVSNDKNTYPRILSLEGAKEKLSSHIEMAHAFLSSSRCSSEVLKGLTDYILQRNI